MPELAPKRKAAVLMAALGEQKAAEMLVRSGLRKSDLASLAGEVARLGEVDPALQQSVLEEFVRLAHAGGGAVGGRRLAERIFTHAFGPEVAAGIVQAGEEVGGALPRLQDIPAKQLLVLLDGEPPRLTAVLLRCLPRKLSGEILSGLPEDIRIEVVLHIAKAGEPSAEAVRRIQQFIAEKAGAVSAWDDKQPAATVGGPRAVVEILNNADLSVESAVLEALAERDPQLGEEVRESMFIFDDLPKLDSKALQVVLREIDPTDLSLALKGSAEALKEAVFRHISSNAAEALKEDLETLGPVRRRDIYAAQERVVMAVRERAGRGDISIRQEAESEEMVA